MKIRKKTKFTIQTKQKGSCDWFEDAWKVEMQVHLLQPQQFVG
jgi:hypothetical protein